MPLLKERPQKYPYHFFDRVTIPYLLPKNCNFEHFYSSLTMVYYAQECLMVWFRYDYKIEILSCTFYLIHLIRVNRSKLLNEWNSVKDTYSFFITEYSNKTFFYFFDIQWGLKSGQLKSGSIRNPEFLKVRFQMVQFSIGWALAKAL